MLDETRNRNISGMFSKVYPIFRSKHRRCSIKKALLKDFAVFTGKHLCLFNKETLQRVDAATCRVESRSLACNFIKKETLAQVFSCEFCETSKNTFFTEHIWTAASERD